MPVNGSGTNATSGQWANFASNYGGASGMDRNVGAAEMRALNERSGQPYDWRNLQVGPGSTSMGTQNPTGRTPFNPIGANSGSGIRQDAATGIFGYNEVDDFDPNSYILRNQPMDIPGGGGGGGGYGGGGGGRPAPNTAAMMEAMNAYNPQAYTYDPVNLQQTTWQEYNAPEYNAPAYYDFDPGMYDQARTGVQQGLAADLRAGGAAYGDARGELSRYQNPFAGRQFTQNQGVSEAMQRMLGANNVDAGQALGGDLRQGAQADQAFNSVLELLGGVAQQRQGAEMRALGGDERRFAESLGSQGRTMNLGIDMALARARSQYEQNKWKYGVDVANQIYAQQAQEAMYNNQGQNATNQANTGIANQQAMANTQGQNAANQANVQGSNDYNQSIAQYLMELAASGVNVDPSAFQPVEAASGPPPAINGPATAVRVGA